MTNGSSDIEGNAVGTGFRILGAGAPKKKNPSVKKELFEFSIDKRSSLKARLPNKLFLAKARTIYNDFDIHLSRVKSSVQWAPKGSYRVEYYGQIL